MRKQLYLFYYHEVNLVAPMPEILPQATNNLSKFNHNTNPWPQLSRSKSLSGNVVIAGELIIRVL